MTLRNGHFLGGRFRICEARRSNGGKTSSPPFISGRVLHLEKVVVQQKGEITRVFYYYFLRLSLLIKNLKFPPNGLCVEAFKK
jgi:hypothetical protein